MLKDQYLIKEIQNKEISWQPIQKVDENTSTKI